MDSDQFREAVAAEGSDPRGFVVLPGPDESRNPEGCVVVDGRVTGWSVYREDRGRKDRVEFTSQGEAFDYALRRWVRYEMPEPSRTPRPYDEIAFMLAGLPLDTLTVGERWTTPADLTASTDVRRGLADATPLAVLVGDRDEGEGEGTVTHPGGTTFQVVERWRWNDLDVVTLQQVEPPSAGPWSAEGVRVAVERHLRDAHGPAGQGTPAEARLVALAEDLVRRGAAEGGEFLVDCGRPATLSSEYVGLGLYARGYEVWYSDMGRNRVLLQTDDEQRAREVFVEEVLRLVRGRGRRIDERGLVGSPDRQGWWRRLLGRRT